MNNIMSKYKKDDQTRYETYDLYGFWVKAAKTSKVDEFITEFHTNPVFQKIIKTYTSTQEFEDIKKVIADIIWWDCYVDLSYEWDKFDRLY